MFHKSQTIFYLQKLKNEGLQIHQTFSFYSGFI